MSSGGGYAIEIPERVAAEFARVVPGGLRDDVLDALERLAENPRLGVRLRGSGVGPMAYTFSVLRAPLVLHVAVGYAFSADEKRIVLTGVVLVEAPDDEDAPEGPGQGE